MVFQIEDKKKPKKDKLTASFFGKAVLGLQTYQNRKNDTM